MSRDTQQDSIPKDQDSRHLLFTITGQATEDQIQIAIERALAEDIAASGGRPEGLDPTFFVKVNYTRDGKKQGRSLIFFRDSRAVGLLTGVRWVETVVEVEEEGEDEGEDEGEGGEQESARGVSPKRAANSPPVSAPRGPGSPAGPGRAARAPSPAAKRGEAGFAPAPSSASSPAAESGDQTWDELVASLGEAEDWAEAAAEAVEEVVPAKRGKEKTRVKRERKVLVEERYVPAHRPIVIEYSQQQQKDSIDARSKNPYLSVTLVLSSAKISSKETLEGFGLAPNVLTGKLPEQFPDVYHMRQLFALLNTGTASYPQVSFYRDSVLPRTRRVFVVFDPATDDAADARELLFFYYTNPRDVPGMRAGVPVKMDFTPMAAFLDYPDSLKIRENLGRKQQPSFSGRGGWGGRPGLLAQPPAQQQPAAYQQQPAAYQQQPAAYQQQPAAYQQQQPAAYRQQPAAYRQQPAAYQQQPAQRPQPPQGQQTAQRPPQAGRPPQQTPRNRAPPSDSEWKQVPRGKRKH